MPPCSCWYPKEISPSAHAPASWPSQSAIAATNAILGRYPKLRDENSLTNILVKVRGTCCQAGPLVLFGLLMKLPTTAVKACKASAAGTCKVESPSWLTLASPTGPDPRLGPQLGTKSFTNKYRLLANDTTALRNQAGSTWNHALFWR